MRKTSYLAAGLSVALAALSTSVPADATGHTATGHTTPHGIIAFKVVANGLHNPRQLAFAHGDLYIAEAGQGGDGTCIPGGEGPSCYGRTGSVTRVRDGAQKRVLKKLASLGNQGTGDAAIGPADLTLVGKNTLVLSFGLGSNPKNRNDLPKLGRKQLGHLRAFNLHTKRSSSLGDLAAHEAKANPVDTRDSDPTGLVRAGKNKGFLVTDSGGNTLVGVKGGKVKGVAAFQDRMGTSPITGPDPVKYQIVPTDVVKGPDGAYYVSELTGFPFIEGAARIWRIVPGHKPHVWANNLTNVTSLAFDGKKLYAVQISDAGLASGPPVGSVRQVFSKKSGKDSVPVASGLPAPYGIAIRHGSAFVSTGATDPDSGSVIKIPLAL